MSKITSTDPTAKALEVVGASGQSVNIFEVKTAAGAVALSVSAAGVPSVGAIAKYNVKEYGAVGDNTTDDSAAIQAAIDACYASASSGVVYFPEGSYLCKTSIQIKVKSGKGLIIEGTGRGSLIGSYPDNDPGVFYYDGSGTSCEGLIIKNLNISGYGSHHPCLYLKDVAYFRLENLWLHNCNSGTYDPSDADAHGLYMNNCVSGAVINCDFDYNRGYGAYLWTEATPPHGQNNAIVFTRCRCGSNVAGGFFNYLGVSDVFEACCAEGNTGNGFDLKGTNSNVLIGPECELNGTDHIHLYDSNKSTTIISPYGDSSAIGVHIESSTGDLIVGTQMAGGVLVDALAGAGSTILSEATVTNNGLARVITTTSTPVRYVSSAAASPPALSVNGEVVVWWDETNSKSYLMIRAHGATTKVECT